MILQPIVIIILLDLTNLFKKLGLEKYVNVFLQQEVDLQTFSTLTDADLKELGISTFGARRKMVTAISGMQIFYIFISFIIFDKNIMRLFAKYQTSANYRYSKAESAEGIVRISERQWQTHIIVVVFGRYY